MKKVSLGQFPDASPVVPPPAKRFGQNFLTNEGVATRIVAALSPRTNETIVEIGPGRGALTALLVAQAGTVVALEFDEKLIPLLTGKFGAQKNFRLIQGDALATEICNVISPAKHARVVGNLPYNIGTAIVQKLIEQRRCVTEMVLMLQKEVVDRITAPPGTSDRGYLSVFVQAYCETEKLFDVAPGSFRPAPKVWSSVIKLTPHRKLQVSVKNEQLLLQVVSAGFAQRRKTILNNLRNAAMPLRDIVKAHGGASIVLCSAEVELQRRAETLTLDEWARITSALE